MLFFLTWRVYIGLLRTTLKILRYLGQLVVRKVLFTNSAILILLRDGGDNFLVVTVAVNFSGVLDAVEISARQQKLQEKGFSIGAKTINVTTIIQARQGWSRHAYFCCDFFIWDNSEL